MHENTRLLASATKKKIPDTTRTIAEVLGNSKETAMAHNKVKAKKTKLPAVSSILFSLAWKL